MKIILIFFTFFSIQFCNAQKDFFIYFQDESQEPFYLKYKNKVYSSTASGYLILPKLVTGEHKVILGIPKLNEKEFPFYCSINDKDIGYKIILQDKDIKLLDINELSVLQPNFASNKITVKKDSVTVIDPKVEVVKTEKKQEVNVADTIAIKVTDPVKEEKIMDQKVSDPIPLKDTGLVKEEIFVEPVSKETNRRITEDPVKIEIPSVTEKIELSVSAIPYVLLQHKDNNGAEVVYVDTSYGKDTIRIFVPVWNAEKTKEAEAGKISLPEVKKPINKPVEKEEKFLDFSVNNNVKKDSLEVKKEYTKDSLAPAIQPLVLVNSDCKKIATVDDYLSLRKKIAGLENEETMLKTAIKAFKQKCYLTEHIRNISVLFLTDENKYLFFQTAYPYIYNTEQFKNLVAELKDPVVMDKFNALIQK